MLTDFPYNHAASFAYTIHTERDAPIIDPLGLKRQGFRADPAAARRARAWERVM